MGQETWRWTHAGFVGKQTNTSSKWQKDWIQPQLLSQWEEERDINSGLPKLVCTPVVRLPLYLELVPNFADQVPYIHYLETSVVVTETSVLHALQYALNMMTAPLAESISRETEVSMRSFLIHGWLLRGQSCAALVRTTTDADFFSF